MPVLFLSWEFFVGQGTSGIQVTTVSTGLLSFYRNPHLCRPVRRTSFRCPILPPFRSLTALSLLTNGCPSPPVPPSKVSSLPPPPFSVRPTPTDLRPLRRVGVLGPWSKGPEMVYPSLFPTQSFVRETALRSAELLSGLGRRRWWSSYEVLLVSPDPETFVID